MTVSWKFLLLISVACYSMGMLHALLLLIRKQSVLFTVAIWAVAAGFVAHTGSLLIRGLEVQRFPLILHQEVCSFLAWAVVAYYLVAHLWYRSQALSSFVMPIVFLLSLTALVIPVHNETPQMLRFRGDSVLFTVHATLFVLSYAAFLITFLAGLMYLIQERELKRKRFGTIFYRLPSLDTCDDLSYKSLGVGFILLTLGIITGIIGSRHLGGPYWRGDPSEFLALATWVIYLFLIHYRLTAGWRGRRAAILSIAGFVMILVSLMSVGYISGFHVFG